MYEKDLSVLGRITVNDEKKSKNHEYTEVVENPFLQKELKSKKLINLVKNWEFVDNHTSLIDWDFNKKFVSKKLEKLIPEFDLFKEKRKRKFIVNTLFIV